MNTYKDPMGREMPICPCNTPSWIHKLHKSDTLKYDYTNQAWVQNGVYVRCGHTSCYHPDPGAIHAKAYNHSCFGTRHAGEQPDLTAEVH